MKKILILCLFVTGFAMAAKKSVAVFPCYGNLNDSELKQLRFKIETIGEDILQSGNFKFLSHEYLDKGIDQKKVFSACSEGGTCVGDLTSDASADYGTWCQIDKVDGKLILYFQLFDNEEKSNLYTNMFRNNADIKAKSANKPVFHAKFAGFYGFFALCLKLKIQLYDTLTPRLSLVFKQNLA